jgi:PAS domain S-box-containing protein
VIRIDSYNSQHQLQRAIDTGLRALRELGVTLQKVPPAEVTLEVLRDLPVMSDRREQAATQILAACFHPIYVGRPELLPTIVLTALHLTITHGLTPAGCLAIVSYAAVFVWPDDIEAAYQFGQLGLQLIERLDDKRYLCQVKAIFDVFLYHWKEPILKVKSAIQQGIQIGFETGNNNYQGTNLITDTMLNALVGQPLPQAQAEMERNLQQLEQVRERYRSYDAYLWTQYVAHLRGMAAEPTQFAGPYFVEETDLPAAKADHIHNTILQFHTLKSMLHFHLGDYRAAYAHARQAEPLVPPAAGSLNIHLVPFYQSLALLRLPERQVEHVEKLDENVSKLRLWANHVPMNYQHKLDIVLAERERVAGNAGTALDHYEQAIAGAKQNKFLQDEALANELYGRFWHERGNDNIAQLYLREAHALYRRWGAGAITAHLEAQYPQWLTVGTIDVSRLGVEVSIAETQSNLDVRSVLKTAEAIAGELDLKKLLQTTIKIMMENAGAQQSFLIVERDGQWLIEAAGEVDTDEVRVLQGINIEDSEQVSAGIVRYVAHTQQMVLLADAASAGQFRQDPIIQRRQVKSVLVVPLINRGQLSGILYLENNLASHAFTPERVELLKLLSSQMAISIDHAWLYDHLEEVVAERTQALSFAEEQIRALFESSQVGISLTTLAGQVLAANKALMLMTGYSERELLQRNVIEFYVDPEQRHELLERLAASEAVHNFGVKFKRKDSSPFFANMNVSQAKRGGQEVLIAMIEDVTEQVQLNEQLQQEFTERKQAEQELQTQITLVDGLLDAAAESVEIWDAQTLEYIKWNKTFRQLTGYSDDEIAAMNPVADFFDDADLARAEAAYARLLQEGQATEILTQINKDGSRIPLEYTGAVIRDIDGNPTQVIVIGRDITERIQAEAQLRFQAELLDAVEQAVVVTDLGGHVVYWNPFAEGLYGWPAEEAMGRLSNELMVNVEVSQQQNAEMTACLLSGKGWSGEYPAFHRDGTLLHVQATITPITNEAGDMIFAIGVSTDITERKQAELALQQSNQSLSQRLDELSTLNLIAQAVSTVVDLPDALDVVVATTTRLLDAAGTGIVLLSDDRSELTLISLFDRRSPAFSGGREGDSEAGSTDAAYRGMVFPVEDSVLTQKLLEEGQAVIVSDAQHDPRLAQAHRILQAGQVCGLMLVPLLSQGNAIGIMGITSDRPGREFTPDEVRLAETIAGQITGAIEATRLLEQVQKRAVAGERSRLARDLHDSVTQSLYSLDLFANAIHQALSAGRTERVTDHAEKIRSLSQSALADLRLLIFELRPPLLDQAGLAGAPGVGRGSSRF